MSADAPKTLLQMIGAPQEPARLEEAALIMIDCQCEYTTGFLPLDGVDAALEVCSAVLEQARKVNAPIFHIAHKGPSGGGFDRDAEGGQIVTQAAPVDGEQVIEKTLPNSFAKTNLYEAVKQTGKQQIILAGFMTHLCISSTARASIDLGLRTTILASATATRSLPNVTGGVVLAEMLQAASLAALADRFAIIVDDVGQLA